MTVQEQVPCDIHNNHFNPFKCKAGLDPKAALPAHCSYDTMLAALYIICKLQLKKAVSKNCCCLGFWPKPQVFVAFVLEKNTTLNHQNVFKIVYQ
jgi:hypothetical protein